MFHSTDVFHKHRKKLCRLYTSIFGELRVGVDTVTPKGAAVRRHLLPRGRIKKCCLITGEPFHDILNLRKLVSPRCNDARDFVYDYSEILNRLSMAISVLGPDETGPPPELNDDGRALLVQAVEESAQHFGTIKEAAAGASRALKVFLEHALVRKSRVWTDLFGTRPPRGSLARIARRAGAELHQSNQAHGWRSKKQFRVEVRRLKAWYQPGKKKSRVRLGMLRGSPACDRVRGRRTVWTAKVDAHCTRLLSKQRFAGLWRWRTVARALHSAGIPVHSGTVPVERLWSQYKTAFPVAARRMTRPWFELLAMICYMRFNYLHFNHGSMPAFAEGDSLLVERIDSLVSLTRAYHSELDGDDDAARALQEAFA